MVINKLFYYLAVSTTIVVSAFMLNGRLAPVPSVDADNCTGNNFSICNITVDCNGQGEVYFTGSIPQGGFTLELMDKATNNAGKFIETTPPTIITITSGTSPVSYSLPLTYWNPPHMRVDSNYNTKSPSIYCSGAGVTPTTEITPTDTPTPTPSMTVTPTATPSATVTPTTDPTITPTPTTDPCANNACVTPTVIETPTPTPTTATPTPTSNNGGNGGSSSGGSSNSSSTTTTQAVLGASTMAETGTFTENLMNILLIAGIISLTAGSLSYAKENHN